MAQRQNFQRIRGRKHDTSIVTRQRRFKEKQRGKYPVLAENIIKMSDIILEILDSRFAQETRNPEMEEMIRKGKKGIIYVLNKSDLADIKKIREKISELVPRVFVSCAQRKGIRELRDKIKAAAKKVEHPVDRALNKVTVGVIGYPNTGKSSVINLLTGKNAMGISSVSGFTKGIQRVSLTSEIVLLDSPGIIPNSEYSTSNMQLISKHAKLGARAYNQVKEPDVVISELVRAFPDVFDRFYRTNAKGNSEILIEELGRKKGFLKKGNEVDEDRTARLILKDWQEGRIKA